MRDTLPLPGDVVASKYEVLYELGRGGMGCVYAVTHRLTGHELALKVLLPEFARDAVSVGRFVREARAAGRIHHRNVIDVLDVGDDGGLHYMVLPLLRGKLLSNLLDERTHTREQLLLILLRVMRGVAAAHEAGIVHRDLKPTNVFVCAGLSGELEEPRVLDFGISKLNEEREKHLTATGVAVGTPHYMPLEQLSGQRDVDARADVYALGVMLYEALTGSLPHQGEGMVAIALSLLHTKPRAPHELCVDLDTGLSAVVMKAIARERDARHADVRALIAELEPFVSLAGHSEARALPPVSAPARSTALPTEPGSAAWLERGAPSAPVGALPDTPPAQRVARSERPSALPALRSSRLWPPVALLGAIAGGMLAASYAHSRTPAERGVTPPALPAPPVRVVALPQPSSLEPARAAQPAPPEDAGAALPPEPVVGTPSKPQANPPRPAQPARRARVDAASPAPSGVMPRGSQLHRDEFF